MKNIIINCDRCKKKCDKYYVVKLRRTAVPEDYEICSDCLHDLILFLGD